MNKMTFVFTTFLALTCLGAPMDGANLTDPLPANLWIEMSKMAQPGVVGVYLDIDIKMKRSRFKQDPFFEFIEEFLGQGFEYENPIEQKKSTPIGTGFLIDKQGHIITNYHVIEATQNPRYKTKLQVQVFGESKLHDVEVLGQDPRGDLALIKLLNPIKNLKPLELGDSDTLKVGEYVAAFGNPYGHSNSMTVGVVSAKGRAIKELNRFPFIQTDASINPGNSGGPLLNTKGYVIGVNTAIDARAQGIGFAIPANYVKKVVGILKSGGTINRAYLGIGMGTLHPRLAMSYGINKRGIVVTDVQPGYPAAKAGIKKHDIIYQFDKRPFLDASEFINLVQDSEIGKTVVLKALRPQGNGFKEMEFKVALTQYPDQKGSRSTPAAKKQLTQYKGETAPYNLGFNVVGSSSGARRYFNVPLDFPFAPIISRVTPGLPAEQSGLEPGNLILQTNGFPVQSSTDVIKQLKKGLNRLLIKTPDGEKKVSLKSE